MYFDNLHKIRYNIYKREYVFVTVNSIGRRKDMEKNERNIMRNAEKGGTFEMIENMPSGKKVIVVIDPKRTSEGEERNMMQIANSLANKPKDKVYTIREEGDKTGSSEGAIAFCPDKFSKEEIAGFMRFWHKRIRDCKIMYA